MKKYLASVIMFLMCGTSAAQSLSLNAGIFEAAHYSPGFYAGAEYAHPIAKKLELTFMSAYLYNSDASENGNLEYKHIPFFAGIRYYFVTGKISPYFSINAGISSVSNSYLVDVLNDPDDILKGTHKILNSYSGIYPGYGSSLGTLIKLSESLNLNFEARMIFVTKNYADFISLTGGVSFGF